MLVLQNELRPAGMQNALFDLMREGIERVRICSAYITISGTEILFEAISRFAPDGNHERVGKTIVTSLDFGLTDPDALRFWSQMAHSEVLVSGAERLMHGSVVPRSAFHPKFYLFDRPDGSMGSLVGSANLTNRGLTINSEVAWLEIRCQQPAVINEAWTLAVQPAVPLTPEIIERYTALRQRVGPQHPPEETAPVPAPRLGSSARYAPFGDAHVDAGAYTQMWIQSHGLQGGARTQLELPRGAHRFFGVAYAGYAFNRVDHIAEPVLVSGQRIWRDRPLTWHGDNAMERINLPSLAMGGFHYEDSLILFRRIAPNTFELRVYPWASDSARAYIGASRAAALVFRVGRNSDRLAGFVP